MMSLVIYLGVFLIYFYIIIIIVYVDYECGEFGVIVGTNKQVNKPLGPKSYTMLSVNNTTIKEEPVNSVCNYSPCCMS